MIDTTEIVKQLREGCGIQSINRIMQRAADTLVNLERERNCCRNELCMRCGEYIKAHLGACDGCVWKS